MRLSTAMRAALTAAQRGPLRRPHAYLDAPAPWPAHPSTLQALERHGLLERHDLRNRHGHPVTTWTITPAGRSALEPREITRRPAPLYLARGSVRYHVLPNGKWGVVKDEDATGSGDYTADPARSVDRDPKLGALPTVNPDDLDPTWARHAEERRAAAQDRRDRARRTRAA